MFTFRSPSLLAGSATRTCGGRTRGAALGAVGLTVGVRPVVEGVVLAANRGVSGARVGRVEAKVGLTGGVRPWALRSDDIPGLRGYRGRYIEGEAETAVKILGGTSDVVRREERNVRGGSRGTVRM